MNSLYDPTNKNAPEEVGLSYAHNSPFSRTNTYAIDVAQGGRLVRSTPIGDEISTRKRLGGGLRRPVHEFSRASRMRMLGLVNALDRAHFNQAAEDLCFFITLTYPPGHSAKRSKRDLDVWLKRMRRWLPDCAGIWKLEYQQNGSPHYHVLLMGVGFLDFIRIGNMWAKVVKSGHPMHAKVGTSCDLVRSQRQASFYLGKYISKAQLPPEGEHYGRFWGTFGDLDRFMAKKLVAVLTRDQVVAMRRIYDAIRRSHSKHRKLKRASDLRERQRWFMDDEPALKVLELLQVRIVDVG